MLLRLGLEVVDRLVAMLPSAAAYRLADVAGEAWYRLAPGRRRVVAANLERVCAVTGRPTRGAAFREIVRSCFRNHARYYVELLRVPRYDIQRIDEHVDVPQWPHFQGPLTSGAAILVSSHVGNFEPFGTFLASRGIRPLSPVEEIEPRPLFEFIAARRGGRHVDLVPLRDARRATSAKLRGGGVVGIIGDRDIAGGGQEVHLFGHATTVPTGPAFLAVTHGAAVIAGRCLRSGADRFTCDGEVLDVPATGDRRADVAELTRRIAARFEHDIGHAPEQWWGAFQPFWPDLGRRA